MVTKLTTVTRWELKTSRRVKTLMAKLYLCAWVVFGVLVGCSTDPLAVTDRMPIEPLLGAFTVFERFEGGFIESQRYGGRITIELRNGVDVGYRVSGETRVVFRFDPKTGVMLPEVDGLVSSTIREIAWRQVGISRPPVPEHYRGPIRRQSVVVLSQSFQQLFLVRDGGPAYWADVPWTLPHGVAKFEDWEGNKWGYKRSVSHAGSRSERVVGALTLGGKPVENARRGDILFTPIGKFMYYGKPDRKRYASGWLNRGTYSVPIFEADGSLTRAGEGDRSSLKGEDRTSPSGLMSSKHLQSIIADVKLGMTSQDLRAAVEKHFETEGRVLVHRDHDLPDGGALVETYNLFNANGSGGFTVHYQPNIQRGPPNPALGDQTPRVSEIIRLVHE